MSAEPEVEIRCCDGLEEFNACVALERAVWGGDDLDIVPPAIFPVNAKTGGQVIGAFDRGKQIGFVLAVPALREEGGVTRHYLHSHMTAVLGEYRNLGIGRKLKLFQREEALSRGIELVEWTFDPLELRNAYFNLVRLGAIVRRYLPNFYGITSSPLHSFMPTDRLVAEWWLRSPRVEAIVAGRPPERAAANKLERIEVPASIEEIKIAQRDDALRIQSRVREQFQHFFSIGYAAAGIEKTGATVSYLLEPYPQPQDNR